MSRSIKIGISSCLIGERVRYDGSHKLDSFLTDTFGQFVEWVPVCPEVESGLTVPREAMRLVGEPEAPRLVTIHTGTDHTERMVKWAQGKIEHLRSAGLCGFIFKGESPSSGMQGVEVYTPSGQLAGIGVGIFARIFIDSFPLLPVEDDIRLRDPVVMESFIKRVSAAGALLYPKT
ncbi:MAG TPA: DUF523 domain-containing protein [Dissulfurispiraceae bacterium]|nr:DUF523 domain-containing protein [Dissulfurispiraceae bacterium]